MYCVKKLAGALDKRRPRRIKKFVANHDDTTGSHGGDVLPRRVPEGARHLRASAGGRPGQNDHFRTGARDIFIRETRTGWHHILPACLLDYFRDPRW
jgi:hypothetical protein